MQGDQDASQLLFELPAAARAAQFREACGRIVERCRELKASRAMLTATTLDISEKELKAGLAALAGAGCGPGFKLACVTPDRHSFEQLVKVEDSALGHGVSVRVFFDQDNARRWLAW